MAKHLFRPVEIVNLTTQRVKIEAPSFGSKSEVEEVEEVYTGPTVEELQAEADAFTADWEKRKQQMREATQEEIALLRNNAENQLSQEKEAKKEEAERILVEAKAQAEKLVTDAQAEAEGLINEAKGQVQKIEELAREEGEKIGRDEGFGEGRKELERLIQRFHSIIDKAIDKREDMVKQTETQIIDLVLLMTRKVVKVITENQRNVVINNIRQALNKLKARGEITIRVNIVDLDLATEHTQDFLDMVEKADGVRILEDSSIEPGGCIIETNLGQVDARISSQLKEIEDRIGEMIPIITQGG